jgi:hypothetical protein
VNGRFWSRPAWPQKQNQNSIANGGRTCP